MSIENGMTATHRLGNRVTAKGTVGVGMRPNASYHMPAPMTRDERIVCAELLGGIAFAGVFMTALLNVLAAI